MCEVFLVCQSVWYCRNSSVWPKCGCVNTARVIEPTQRDASSLPCPPLSPFSTFDPTRQFTVSREYKRSGLPENFGQLGRRVTTTFNFLNRGPRDVTSGNLSLSIPYRSACTNNAFLYYVASVQVGHMMNM